MRALVIGARGQDGRILTKKLESQGVEVLGLTTPAPGADEKAILLHSLIRFSPTHIFNLAGFSSVWQSWESPSMAVSRNTLQTANFLEAVREANLGARILIASSSEIFESQEEGVSEMSLEAPTSPYGVSKKAAVDLARAYRTTDGLDIRILHLFNHESPLRGDAFLSQKIATGVANIALGLSDKLSLSNLESQRDWGYAPDFVEAMILVMGLERPDDFVVSTNRLTSVTTLLESAFAAANLVSGLDHVEVSGSDRPLDSKGKKGNHSKLTAATGWNPTKDAQQVIHEMVHYQIAKKTGQTNDEAWLSEVAKR